MYLLSCWPDSAACVGACYGAGKLPACLGMPAGFITTLAGTLQHALSLAHHSPL